jgi:hypothetical protein
VKRLLALAVLPLLSSCGGAGHPGSNYGALEGKVMIGPVTPACIKGKPCSKPARGVTLRFSKQGASAVSVKTRSDGTYKVGLPPGRYSVAARLPVQPEVVSVPGAGVRRINFALDTGIR